MIRVSCPNPLPPLPHLTSPDIIYSPPSLLTSFLPPPWLPLSCGACHNFLTHHWHTSTRAWAPLLRRCLHSRLLTLHSPLTQKSPSGREDLRVSGLMLRRVLTLPPAQRPGRLIFGHDGSKSSCFPVRPVTCWHLSVFLYHCVGNIFPRFFFKWSAYSILYSRLFTLHSPITQKSPSGRENLQVWAGVTLYWTPYNIQDLGKPTNALVSCWMPKPLPTRNRCMGWFAPGFVQRSVRGH